ncbi:hypothetical protein TorRG33x02_237880 [Trema orientale]|uniref:Uncharacterized protein n=1 Tax=Trema orientale TaxID=63057 RepID=A0A2P5DYW2_TREOI|nr:hypothetical protein TorRG33x02_237880 [Trema orientale]
MPWSLSSETLENGYLVVRWLMRITTLKTQRIWNFFNAKLEPKSHFQSILGVKKKKKKTLVLIAYRVSTPTTHHPKTRKHTTYIQSLELQKYYRLMASSSSSIAISHIQTRSFS